MAGENRVPVPAWRAARWLRAAGLSALAAMLLLTVLYLARTYVFARLGELYFFSRGVPASIAIDRLDWSGFDARLRLGARRTPDLLIDRLHGEFGGEFIPRLGLLTLSGVTLRVGFDGDKLSFGTLQRLIDSYRAPAVSGAPNSAAAQGPSLRIVFTKARLFVFTPLGVLSLTGSGALAGNRIERVLGNIGRANLRGSSMGLLLSGGTFSARSDSSGLMLHARLNGHGLYYGAYRASQLQAVIEMRGLHAESSRYRLSRARAVFSGQSLSGNEIALARGNAQIDLSDWGASLAEGFSAKGLARASIHLNGVKAGPVTAGEASLSAQSPALLLSRKEARLQLSGPLDQTVRITGAGYRTGDATIHVSDLTAHAKGEVEFGKAFAATLTASLKSRLAVPASDARRLAHDVAYVGSDKASVRAVQSALRALTLEAPSIYIGKSSQALIVALPKPVTLASPSGARARLAQMGEWLFASHSGGAMTGGLSFTFSGGGLGAVDLMMPGYTARRDKKGFWLDSPVKVSAKTSLAQLRGASLLAEGHFSATPGGLSFEPKGCVALGLGAYRLKGVAYVNDLRTGLCPRPGAPLFVSQKGQWTLAGRLRNFSADLAQAQTHAESVSGEVAFAGGRGGMGSGVLKAASIRLTDRALTSRFAPLRANADLHLARGRWQGRVEIALAKSGRALARVTLHHDLKSGSGEARIVSDLSFAPGGLQPGEVSPLLASLKEARAMAEFRGRLDWTTDGLTSNGRLMVNDGDFIGPLGTFRHAAMKIVFTSLVPLKALPSQTFSAQTIEWLVPVRDLSLHFGFGQEAIRLEDLKASVAGGQIRLSPMTITFGSKGEASGALELDRVDLGALIAASNLSDKISLNAPVRGTIPFRYSAKGLRIRDGYFQSTGPSRLSIKRTVWMKGEGEETDAVRDFAYQALENLAIDALDAQLNSLPKGRLGVVFHIKGRNDPKVAKEPRISVIALIRGHAFDKPLPLPKGTLVDLTLDTSLNFDELLDAYREAFSAGVAKAQAHAEQNEGTTP